MTIEIVTEQEVDGRWIADIEYMPGVMVYGSAKEKAVQKVQELA